MFNRQSGQGMTEYIIIVALIAIAAIGSFRFFGNTARTQVAGMAKELSGQDGTQQINASRNAANSAATRSADKTLGTYSGGNQ